MNETEFNIIRDRLFPEFDAAVQKMKEDFNKAGEESIKAHQDWLRSEMTTEDYSKITAAFDDIWVKMIKFTVWKD